MDTRQLNKSLDQLQQQKFKSEQELNDSLIYNIMKKIELRQRLVQEYKKQKQQTNKGILAKYFVHSSIPMYYGALIVVSKLIKIIHMKPGTPIGTIFTIPNILFHVCVFLSLNEYYKYRNMFYLKPELGEEYKIYQRNVESLMEEKIAQFSLINKLNKNNMLNQDQLMQTLKYRLVL